MLSDEDMDVKPLCYAFWKIENKHLIANNM